MSIIATEATNEKIARRSLVEGTRRASSFYLVADLASLILSIPLAHYLSNFVRAQLHIELLSITSAKFADETILTLALGACLILWLFARKHYSTRQTNSSQFKDIFVGCLGAFVATALFSFLIKGDPSRLSVVLTWTFAGFLMLTARHMVRLALMRYGTWFAPTLLLGTPEQHERLELIIRAHPELGMKVVSNLKISHVVAEIQRMGNRIGPDEMHRVLKSNGAVRVLIAPSKHDFEDALDLIEVLQRLRIPYIYAPETGALSIDNMMVQSLSPFDGVLMSPLDNLDRPLARIAKSAADRIVSFVALLVLLPLFSVVALAIKLDGGPVFFRQDRIRRGGKIFKCLKFRTMAVDAEERLLKLLAVDPDAANEWSLHQKLKNDPRVTPIGSFLRKTSLDELPQLINVLKGEMSMVGPRPVVPGELDKYGDYADYYHRVDPGVTGLWQVNGRNSTTYEERVRLDAYYVRNWTLWRDFCIAIKTIPEMLWNRSGM